jgi:RNA polymerase sigma-70 factor (ECF subfamily)
VRAFVGDVADERADGAGGDDTLAAALARGDARGALGLLVDRHGDAIYGYCRRMLGNQADADDVAQVVFVQAFEGLRDLSKADSARAWLFGIARHRCLDRLRSRKRGPLPVGDDELHRAIDAEAPAALAPRDAGAVKALDDCLDALEERSRAVVLLRFQDGVPYDEISALTGDSTGALRVRVNRALPALRRCLEGKGVTL